MKMNKTKLIIVIGVALVVAIIVFCSDAIRNEYHKFEANTPSKVAVFKPDKKLLWNTNINSVDVIALKQEAEGFMKPLFDLITPVSKDAVVLSWLNGKASDIQIEAVLKSVVVKDENISAVRLVKPTGEFAEYSKTSSKLSVSKLEFEKDFRTEPVQMTKQLLYPYAMTKTFRDDNQKTLCSSYSMRILTKEGLKGVLSFDININKLQVMMAGNKKINGFTVELVDSNSFIIGGDGGAVGTQLSAVKAPLLVDNKTVKNLVVTNMIQKSEEYYKGYAIGDYNLYLVISEVKQ